MLLVQFAVGVHHTDVGSVDISPRFSGSLGGEGELEEAVGIHHKAVAVGKFIGHGVCRRGKTHLFARHLPFHHGSLHGRAAVADRGAVEGDGLPESCRPLRDGRSLLLCRIRIAREGHHEVGWLVGLHYDVFICVVGVGEGMIYVGRFHAEYITPVPSVGRNDKFAMTASVPVGGEIEGVIVFFMRSSESGDKLEILGGAQVLPQLPA